MPPAYSTHVIVNVFRCVAQLVSQNPELLNWPGVFRLAGSREESEKLLEQVINDNFSVGSLACYILEDGQINNLLLNNVLGMLPLVLKESVLLKAEDPLLKLFMTELKNLLGSEKNNVENTDPIVQLLSKFIDSLLLSKILDHQRVGEILYHYCYLMHTAGVFHETNLMTWENLAIIMAPHFTNEFGLYSAEDLLGLIQFTNQLKPILECFIAHPDSGIPFKERHADKLEHLVNTRHTIIEKLTHMGSESRRIVVAPMKSLMMQASMLRAQIDAVETQLKDSSFKKKDKKELNRQLEKLTEELEKLNIEISESTSKIKKMNHGHAKLKEEIRAISRSEDAVSTHATQQSGASSSSSNSVRIQLGIFGNNSSSSAYLIEEQKEGEVTENEYSGLDSAKLT
ncbi:Dot/Icm T4SS effector MavB [Legionella pneumophila serogroup 1]|nr:Dot/Icm T4SS effector MavB [Legionella pneumophila]HAU0938782.1 Dot/Icm T4SS effector MavB [Legionella pneumophila]HDO7871404.1 Dot/Icm T4SS effector MavB [Legionella pneumophila]HDO7938958.1 Dot/Icm T4SS effector MavB [Legionella pneumophila]HDO8156345.1 Dot/Icm T4SS effector MavB [Legionella pneumophila]